MPEHEQSDSYDALLAEVSAAIVEARVNAQFAVVSELVHLHQRCDHTHDPSNESGCRTGQRNSSGPPSVDACRTMR